MHQSLLALLEQIVPLTQPEAACCVDAFDPIQAAKNQVLEKAGHAPAHLYFIVSGYVRLFYEDANGQEITTHINCPPGFITSYVDFIQQLPTQNSLQCLTDCDLLRITQPALQALFAYSDNLTNVGFAIFQQSITYNETRSHDLANLSALERYRKLMTTYPGILQNVPVRHVASFLGIQPETLSRIRRQIIS